MQRKQKVVLDTNILISALLGSKNCKQIRDDWVAGIFTVLVSDEMLGEFLDASRKPKFHEWIREEDILETQKFLEELAVPVLPVENVSLCSDPEDNMVLECALAGKADVIVTGDKALLALKTIKGIRIVTPTTFINRF